MKAIDVLEDITDEAYEFLDSPQFTLHEISSNMNGYPDSLNESGKSNYCLIGFDNYEQAQRAADLLKAEIHLFKKRDGHHFWYDVGTKYEPLTVDDYLKDLGDNYSILDFDELKEQLKLSIDDANNENIVGLLDEFSGNFEALSELDENESLILSVNGLESVKNKFMSYHEDVTTWSVGLLIEHKED